MKPISCRLVFAALLGVSVLPAWCAPLEAYARLPQFDKVTLSPDGKSLAYVAPKDKQFEVIVHPLGSDKNTVAIDVGAQPVHELTWLGNGALAITGTDAPDYDPARRFEHGATWIYDFHAHELQPLRAWLGSELAANVLTAPPQVRVVQGRTSVYLQTWMKTPSERSWFSDVPLSKGFLPAVFRVDPERGRADLLQLGPGAANLQDVLLDSAGEPVAESSFADDSTSWSLEVRHDGRWRKPQLADAALGPGSIVGFAAEDGWALVRMPDQSVQRFSLQDGTWGKPVASGHETGALLTDPLTRRLVGGESFEPARRYTFYQADAQAAWDKVVQAFPGEDVELLSWSDDRRRMVVRVSGEKSGAVYALADLDADRVSVIGAYYAGIGPADVAPVEPIAYAAADGLSIPGYLTLPKGTQPANLPLVVLPHEGPAGRDLPGFNWLAQALASRGYAVLQPNFRGSAGLGGKFLTAGYDQWGRKMQSDLADGVRYLVDKGVADAGRVCIVGAGYGGYAALTGAEQEGGPYRCAAAFGAISDLVDLLAAHQPGNSWRVWRSRPATGPDSYEFRRMTPFIGASSPGDALVSSLSPARHADQAGVPLLLIDTRDDSVVPSDQSRRMAESLQRAGKPFELVELPGDDHWLAQGETRTRVLNALIRFLEKNDGPKQGEMIETRREGRPSVARIEAPFSASETPPDTARSSS
ncbi:MAG: prolyl oligopeptidase family serine peptidase [Nevskia sp.]|nr:prolyl oligopeptidase family serine peptidase [Nevskia sp.]